MNKISHCFALSFIWVQTLVLPYSKIAASDDATLKPSATWQSDDTILIEWDAEPNEFYEVIHTADLIHWQHAIAGQFKAPQNGGRLQWVDTSPNISESRFNESEERYYKVVRRSEIPLGQETPLFFSPFVGLGTQAVHGTFQVPENRTDPDIRTITLHYVRFPSTSSNPGSPIVYLAGGPGDSGIEVARLGIFPLIQKLRELSDVIAFDQRGTGWSNDIPPYNATTGLPLDEPLSSEAMASLLLAESEKAVDFWESQGVDIDGYNVLENARDIDDLRKVLGAEKVSLWGASFGSQLGLATIRELKDRVDRVVLRGMEGVSQTVKQPARTDVFMDRIQAAINTQPATVAIYPDVKALIHRVHDDYEGNPLNVTFNGPGNEAISMVIGKEDLQLLSATMLANPADIRNLLSLYSAADRRELSSFAPVIYELFRDDEFSFLGMREVTDIMSGISDTRLALVEEQAETSLFAGYLNFPMPLLKDGFRVHDLGEAFRSAVVSDVPLLSIYGTLDGRNYPDSIREATAGFSNLTEVAVINGGHWDYMLNSTVVHQIIIDFFRGNSVPGEVAVPLPDFTN